MTVNSAIFEVTVGQETLLFNEDSGRLVLLDTVATAVWLGLNAGLEPGEIAAIVAEESGADEAVVLHDVDVLLRQWASLGILQRQSTSPDYVALPSAGDATNPAAPIPTNLRAPARAVDDLPSVGTFGVGNVVFEMRSSESEVSQAAKQLFDHLRVDCETPCHFKLTVERDDDNWTLYCDSRYQACCDRVNGVAPMLHANVLLLVYHYSNADFALHAAAVAVDENCVIFPAESGSGKSTLSSALISGGFRFCSDDLVLLSGRELAVIPVSFCIGLKEGAWKIVETRVPTVTGLAVHVREDGKSIRYLPPLPNSRVVGRDERLKAGLLIFPTYGQDCHNEHRDISSGEALVRLTQAGYDIARPFNGDMLQRLVTWIAGIRCIELRYNSLDYAIDVVVSLSGHDQRR